MTGWPILSTITFLPLAGALWILFFVRHEDEALAAKNARSMALWASLVTFVVSLFLWFNFDRDSADFQFVEQADWIPAFNINYHMGVDGISRSEEHTSDLQSLMRISYAVFCLKKKHM